MISEWETKKLKPGMYVLLPGSWFSHRFLKSEFKIETDGQIREILAQGFPKVEVDLALSDPEAFAPDEEGSSRQDKPPPTIIPESLADNLNAGHLHPQEQAQAIRDSALELMQNLLATPTAANIRQAKEAIYKITDHIIDNDETTQYLVKLTSHDYYTYTHSVNVGILGIALAKDLYLGQKGHHLQELGAGFFLHDIGKVRIDNGIINKNGPLTPPEMEIMRRHPAHGFNLLSQAKMLTPECKYVVWQHHERYDGTGYPHGLPGGEIHEYAKICALADVYDALTARRAYKEPLTPFQALDLMKKQMLPHFQKSLFDRLVLLLA